MAASYTILPVQLDDLPALADLVHTSKLALPVNQLLFRNWPNDAAQKPLYTQAVVSSHNDPTVRDLKAVDTISGKIAGYIAFSRKHPTAASASIPDTDSAKDDTQQPQQQSSTPEGLNPDVLAAIAGLGAETARHFDSLARYDVIYICTEPFSKRRGVAAALLQRCLDEAKENRLPVSVCSEPAAREFFESEGFEGTWHYDIDLAKFAPRDGGYGLFRLTGMLWKPT